MSDKSDTFSLEEYRSLRGEVLARVEAVEKLALLAAGAVAAVYSWLAAQHVRSDSPLWYVPVLFPAVGAFRAWIIGGQIEVIGEYLRKLEQELGSGRLSATGWEKYREDNLGRFFDVAMRVFWALLIAATLGFPSWNARSPEGVPGTRPPTSAPAIAP